VRGKYKFKISEDSVLKRTCGLKEKGSNRVLEKMFNEEYYNT
jgi:hypothetical protein